IGAHPRIQALLTVRACQDTPGPADPVTMRDTAKRCETTDRRLCASPAGFLVPAPTRRSSLFCAWPCRDGSRVEGRAPTERHWRPRSESGATRHTSYACAPETAAEGALLMQSGADIRAVSRGVSGNLHLRPTFSVLTQWPTAASVSARWADILAQRTS